MRLTCHFAPYSACLFCRSSFKYHHLRKNNGALWELWFAVEVWPILPIQLLATLFSENGSTQTTTPATPLIILPPTSRPTCSVRYNKAELYMLAIFMSMFIGYIIAMIVSELYYRIQRW